MPPAQTLRNGGILAIVIVGSSLVYWRSQRTREPDRPTSPHPVVAAVRESTPDPTKPVAIAQPAPMQPVLPSTELPKLPALANGSAATTPAEVFAVESRDAAWAAAIEAEIKDRMVKSPAKLAAECRFAHCQLTLDGPTEAVGKAIAMFESERGLVGFADNIYLTKPELHDDGTTTVRAIASFTR